MFTYYIFNKLEKATWYNKIIIYSILICIVIITTPLSIYYSDKRILKNIK